MSLVIYYRIGDVQDSRDVSVSEMTYIVSGWALNATHLSNYCLSRLSPND